jgi:hypothetical protein
VPCGVSVGAACRYHGRNEFPHPTTQGWGEGAGEGEGVVRFQVGFMGREPARSGDTREAPRIRLAPPKRATCGQPKAPLLALTGAWPDAVSGSAKSP